MSQTETSVVLKTFASRITTSSVKERRQILADLIPCVKSTEFSESAQKGVIKHLLYTLGRYHDNKSRHAVDDVVRALAETNGQSAVKGFVLLLGDIAEQQKTLPACALNSGAALSALTWSCMLVRIGLKTKAALTGTEFGKLTEIQSLLLHGSFSAQKLAISNGAYNRLKRIWREIPGSVEVYCSTLVTCEPSLYYFCLISCIVKFLSSTKEHGVLNTYKAKFIDHYVKAVLGSRMRLQPHVLESCKALLRQLSHDEFREVVLPAVQKSMLRNPEIILEGVSEMLAGLNIDLSQYALDLAKPIANQLHSKDETTRDIAAAASRHLARQCSDPGSVEKLVKHFFNVLNGSEGKLTVTAQRMGMLTGVGNLSYNTVTGGTTVQNLGGTVAEFFMPVLQQEVHEATLVHALSMLSLWCSKFSTQVPDKVIEWFKKGIGLKSSTSAVRNAYIQCMSAAFHGDTLIQGLAMMPMLLQTLDKAKNQQSQVQLVTEGLSAACLLAKLSLSDIQAESKMGPFWSTVLDMNKQLFVNDKFLTAATDNALQTLVTLTERLILDHPQKLNDKNSRMYYKALVYALTHSSYGLRKHTAQSIKKILSALGGAKLSIALIAEFREILQSQQLQDTQSEGDCDSGSIKPRVLWEALTALCNIPSMDGREAGMIAMEILIDAHHPCIVCEYPHAWRDIVLRLKLDPVTLVTNYVGNIVPLVKEAEVISPSLQNAVQSLTHVAPKAVLPHFVNSICECYSNTGFFGITRDEYLIMKTPAGELHDKSILESAAKTETKEHNIKRENKLYSYAEQMAEIELKKELEKKKGKGSAGKEDVKLTKKQQEAMQVQLEKESIIRAKLLKLDEQLLKACMISEACVEGNPAATRKHLPTILKCLVPLLSSPLAAPRVSQVLIHMRNAAFENGANNIGKLIAYTMLRLLEPECEVASAWCQEPIRMQAKRAVTWVLETVDNEDVTSPYPAPTFCYVFYMLQALMNKFHVVTGKDDQLMMQIIQLLSIHSQLREGQFSLDEISHQSGTSSMNDLDEVDESGPELLPRELMIRLLITVISTHTGKIQTASSKALLDVCECASGLEGCTAAEQGEIDALLDGLQAPAAAVREAALAGLTALLLVLPSIDTDFDNGMKLAQRVWAARYDIEDEVRKLAENLWTEAQLDLIGDLCVMLIEDVIHDEEVIRSSAAEACAAALKQHKDKTSGVLQQLLEIYEEKLYMPPPVLDNFGRLMSEAPPDKWPARSGIALALRRISPTINQNQIEALFEFFVQKALGDRNEAVRQKMLDAAVTCINDHGKENVSTLLPVFEEFLLKAPDSASFDAVRQSVVILMGSLAKHLDKDDPKVKPIVNKLITALGTPSQQVQEAVANCLPPLVPAIKADAPELVSKLMTLLLESDNYGERKGAAHGLAGLVKGLGILALKQLEIMTTLTNAIQNKKNHKHREGALFAFEMLCLMLGRLFEPYVVHLLPHLLLCFGDGNQYVREAADDTAKAVMKNLSAHGVKLVLPSLLTALEEDSWRTKTGSVELLGAMAFCAPKQLSACLPNIVPKLIDVLTDSHMKVQKAGGQALKQIGSVIKNPEIKIIVPVLLDALQDPTKKTTACLLTLLDTKFVHFVDAPSLALIMPVVQRAFQDRSTETRKMAAQIIGNMYSLTDQKDLSPYLPTVIPGLKASLLDPVPEVRSVSARALGAIVKGMGEKGFEDLLPWLMETLTSEQSSVDRSGAAQGLSEVVGGLGLQKLEKLMPDIIQTAERNDIAPHVRDGYIMMYIFLPTVFGEHFTTFVGPIIPSILKALADESEFVRDTALRAGQRIVNVYADTAIALLLPELEKGLFDDNWRIRFSSVQLLGDLLYRISGVTGKMSTQSAGDDDNFGTEGSQTAILRTLGEDRRNRVLAGLYMGRSDTALMVRQSALHVWKVIVTHTPKTLREILPTLFQLLLGCLASNSYDKRQVAARTLGDIVRKLGEKVLPEIIPILENGLESERADQRQGVCIGLSEIMSSTSREHVFVFADSLIPTVKKALIDPLPEVREAAAETFDNLHSNLGTRALDDILPELLEKLADEQLSEYALDGLKQVMTVKGRVVLPYLVPQLTAPPVNTRALASLSSVAGEALTRHLSKILPALMTALGQSIGTENEQEELSHCETVVLSVSDDIGLRTIMDELLGATTQKEASMRCAAVTILHAFCQQTKLDYSEYVSQLFRGLLHVFTQTETPVLEAAWSCLQAVTKSLDASDMLQQIGPVRQAIRFAVSDFKGTELPGFCLPKKGITPILPIFREGILNGPPELKESAAIGLGEVIRRTSAEALKPSVVNITGPLIRILGERYSHNVRVAVLDTLGLLLGKCGAMLKAFLPQLQTTFVKALNDSNRLVRLKAASALGKLVVIHLRVDPLFNELHTGVKNAEEPAIRDTMLQALRGCIGGAGSKMGEAVKKQLVATLEGLLSVPEDVSRMSAAGCLGALCQHLGDDDLSLLLNMHLLDTDVSLDWETRHGRGVALSVAVKEAHQKLLTDEYQHRVVRAALDIAAADRIPISLSGLRAVGYILYNQTQEGNAVTLDLLSGLNQAMRHESNDIKHLVAVICTFIAKSSAAQLNIQVIKGFVPSLLTGAKEKNTIVRSSSETALVAVLQMHKGDTTLQACYEALDGETKESLKELVNKTLRKVAQQINTPAEDIDDTLLK